MKSWVTVVAAVAIVATPAAVRAQGAGGMKPPVGKTATVTGVVVDVSCKFGQGLGGPEHKMCSEVCADRGLPLAILSDDGKLYVPTSAGMPGDAQNSRLKPFAEQRVTVSGKVFDAAGAHAIQITQIAAAR